VFFELNYFVFGHHFASKFSSNLHSAFLYLLNLISLCTTFLIIHDCTLLCSNSIEFPDNVEMEIVLPGSMTVIDSHDIALALQHKIEAMTDVERAFVHVDHQERDGLEHKVSHFHCPTPG
jgi:Dimerisation domain of Zinc Transporter